MALPSDYIAGTITLTNGSTAFTGAGTGWLAADFREGDIILDVEGGEGAVAVIQSITSNTAGVLSKEWEGATVTGAAYRMRYQWDSGRVSAQSRAAIEMLGNGNLQSFSAATGPGVVVMDGPHSVTIRPEADFVNGVAYDVQVDTLADRDAYDGQSEGFAVLVADVGDGRSALYSKNSNTVGDWSDPAYVTGPVGPLPDVEATVDMLPPGSTATVTPTPITGGVRLDFELPEASGFYNAGVYDIAEAYNQDDVVAHNGSSFIALQAVPAGEEPDSAYPPDDTAYWQVLARAGVNGAGTVTQIVAGDNITVDNSDPTAPIISSEAGVTDGDKGDITVTGSGSIWEVNDTEIARTGAVARTLISRFNEGRVSVFDFMNLAEIADYQSTAGALDHTAAAQAALDSGAAIVYFPEGLLSLRGSVGLTVTTSGQQILGSGWLKTYINTPTTGTGIDLIRIAASRVRVNGLLFRPGRDSDYSLKVYSGECEVAYNRFLSASPNAGTSIYLTDQNPSGVFVGGAYSHQIHHNLVGATNLCPLFFVETAGTSGGQNALRIHDNQVMSNRAVYLHAGGGIVIRDNKFQSATGTQALKVGRAIECVAAVGVIVSGNYLEKYLSGIYLGQDAGEVYDGVNHWDNVGERYTRTGSPLPQTVRRVAIESGVYDFGFTANSQTRTPPPDQTTLLAYGAGGARTGCLLGAGQIDGQKITLVGGSQLVEILPGSTIRFAGGATAANFGSSSGNVMIMQLLWHSQVGRWWEVSRTLYV